MSTAAAGPTLPSDRPPRTSTPTHLWKDPTMPIRPENRHRYGPDWPKFSHTIRFDRARGRCECEGQCGRGTHDGRCPNEHGGQAYGTGSKVVLTVAHLCHTPECREHVLAMCQGCHLHYDRDHHTKTRAATLAATRMDTPLPIADVAATLQDDA